VTGWSSGAGCSATSLGTSTAEASGCFGVNRGVGTLAVWRSALSMASSNEPEPQPAASTARPTLEPASAARALRRSTGACSTSSTGAVGTDSGRTGGLATTLGGAQGHVVVPRSDAWPTLPPTIPPLDLAGSFLDHDLRRTYGTHLTLRNGPTTICGQELINVNPEPAGLIRGPIRLGCRACRHDPS
jgi:hypothetical protein